MSDKKEIPSWQRTASPPSPASPPEQEPIPEQHPETEPAPTPAPGAEEATSSDSHPDSAPLLEQAVRFLEDPAIRDAPREKKVTFLESKGVRVEDIEELLPTSQEDTSDDIDLSQIGEMAWSKVSHSFASPTPYCIMPVMKTSYTEYALTFTDPFTNGRSQTPAQRYPSDRHVSRIPCAIRKAAASHHYQALAEYRIHNRRSRGNHVRIVQVHHCTDGAESRRVAA